MKRIILTLLLLPILALAEYYPLIPYGKATTIEFVLYTTAGALDIDEADGGTEVTIHCNGDAGTTATNDFVDEGSYYSLVVTAAETACARMTLDIAATDRNVVIVPTFGHPLAEIISYEPYKAAGLVDAAGTTSTLELATGDSAADDFYNGYVGKIVGGTGVGQEFIITDYANTGNVATITTLVTNTSTDSYYIILTEKRAAVTVDASGNVAADVKLAEAVDWTDQVDSRLTAYDAATGAEIATAQAAIDLLAPLVLATGTCDSGSTTTCVDATLTTADDDYYAKGLAILFTSGTLAGQNACIYDFVAATDTITFRPAVTQAVTTHTYSLITAPVCGGVVAP